ncbi:MAG: AIR synthase-related protein, partial [Candidatus Omnitrophica bacterium]|nr:AIR synthase-related protein [Candidatus Omnitrophota bacterium]
STYFGVPFISGKDSLYNEYAVEGKRISIPGTLLISAMSVIDNWQDIITANLKNEGNLIYLVGLSKPEMGACEYFRKLKTKGGIVPKVDKETAKKIFDTVSKVIKEKLVISCHDLSEGGLAVAISEMCMGSNLGANVFLKDVPKEKDMANYEVLFCESPTRFLVEVPKDKKQAFEKQFKDIPFGLIGCVSKEPKLVIYANETEATVNLKLEDLRDSWLGTFKEFR